ncbi:hypothetical protein AQJ43_21740 [Streptomyces avermitilis]|nr:hypothetical protein AQJ43_21740 [Streptomyces avermitilis]
MAAGTDHPTSLGHPSTPLPATGRAATPTSHTRGGRPMSERTARTRLFAAAAVALAALALTACENGEGVRDEGPSAASKSATRPTGSTPTTAPDTADTTPGTTTAGSPPCTADTTRIMATEVSRPLNHLLLTLTNTGSRTCTLTGHPVTRFGEARSVPAARETRPRAAVRLSPRESAYAGVLLSSGDGSGASGSTAKTLTITFKDGSTARPALPPRGVHVDDRLTVTYWQSSMDTALTY